MFNMGFTEMLVLGVIALLVIGPKQLPEVAKVIGRTLNEFKRATGDLTSTFYNAKREAETYVNKTSSYMHQQKDEFEKSLNKLNEDIEQQEKQDQHEGAQHDLQDKPSGEQDSSSNKDNETKES